MQLNYYRLKYYKTNIELNYYIIAVIHFLIIHTKILT